MFINTDPCIEAVKTIKFNRFITLAFGINALFLMLFSSSLFIMTNWVLLALYFVTNEVFLSVLTRKTLTTEKICTNIQLANIFVNSVFFISFSLSTGNTDYIFLCTIPIFQALLKKKKQLSLTLLFATAIITSTGSLAGWFKLPFLAANINPVLSKTLSFITVLGILSYIIKIFAKLILHSNNKADILHNMATTDALTGLINRREFNRRISAEFSRAKRHKHPLSIALFDIDFFKKINDAHGHLAGDAILRELGQLITNKTRNSDISARYGGEEFALILPETKQTEAVELLDRLREFVENEIFYKSVKPINATISAGVAQLDLTDATPEDFCERADKALYKAKESGRNRVEKAPFGVPKIIQAKAERKAV